MTVASIHGRLHLKGIAIGQDSLVNPGGSVPFGNIDIVAFMIVLHALPCGPDFSLTVTANCGVPVPVFMIGYCNGRSP